MFKPRHCAIVAIVLCAFPCMALMELFGKDPMPVGSSWPRELGELLNDETRFAGDVGPIADCVSYHKGDTDEFNAFLEAFSKVPDTTLKVRIVRGDYTIHMKHYDGTDSDRTADWTFHIAEFMEARPDKKQFKGNKCYAEISINSAGSIKFGKLTLPSNLVIEASAEFSIAVQNLNRRLEVAAEAPTNGPQVPGNQTVRRGKPVCCK